MMMGMLGAIGAAGGGGFTPASLTGLLGWWDANNLTLSGANVTAAADLSGSGNNLGPYASAPQYNATGLNSRPTMDFAGASATRGLAKAGFAFGTGSTLTAFFVGKLNSSLSTYGRALAYFAGGANDADNNASFVLSSDNATTGVVLYRNTNTAARAFGTAAPHRCIATVKSDGVMTIYVDGVSTTGATLLAAFGASGTLAIGLAAFASTSGWDGSLSEVGIATGYSDATAVGQLDSYLQTKWGL